MTARLRIASASLAAAALLVHAAVAVAEPADANKVLPLAQSLQGRAKDAYAAATKLYKQGDFEGAETKYSEAYDAAKDPRLVFDMAACERQLHHYARMGALLRRYKQEAGASLSAEDRAKADGALDALAAYVGTVALTVDPAGATVVVDGETVGAAPLSSPLWLDPGKHVVVVRKEGFESVERPISVSAGTTTTLAISLLGQSDKGTAAGAAAELKPFPSAGVSSGDVSHGARWSPLVYAGFGLAGAGLVTGAVTGAIAIGKASSLGGACQNKACPPSANDDLQAGRTMGTVSTVAFVVAGVGAAVGTVALLLSPRQETPAKVTGATVTPWVGVGSAGFEGTF